MNALDVRNLTVAFGGPTVIRDLSFSVRPGERLVLFGPNGAGKTTLFNVISGLVTRFQGSIAMFGTDVGARNVSKRVALGLGRTFQITTLFPDLTVLESTILALQAGESSRFAMFRPLLSYEGCRDQAMELLSAWGIAGRAQSFTRVLSYGEQRQVELVLALARRPRLLLLDEPAAGLSVSETEIVEEMIEKMERDVTLLMVEHDIEMAMRVADRVLVMQNGAYVTSGTPAEVHADPEVAKIYFGEQHGA
jgi:branched-chain amino acid transport system ATP-binding protein